VHTSPASILVIQAESLLELLHHEVGSRGDVPREVRSTVAKNGQIGAVAADVHQGDDLVTRSANRGLESVLDREGIDVDDVRLQLGIPQEFDVLLDHFLAGGDQENLHLIGADIVVDDLEVERDVVDVERDVLLRLPQNGFPSVRLRHLVHQDLLDDDRASADGTHDPVLGNASATDALANGLHHHVPVHDLTVHDGLGQQIHHGKVSEHRRLARVVDAHALDLVRSDVEGNRGPASLAKQWQHRVLVPPAAVAVRRRQ
jgi:hypothetical protein